MRDERSLGFIKMTFCNNIATLNRLWAYENKILTEKANITGQKEFGLMKMTFRWYGEGDSIPLSYIRQIPA